jgi:hypothetical protein
MSKALYCWLLVQGLKSAYQAVVSAIWKISASYVNSGKPVNAILMSSKVQVFGGTMKNLLVFALALILLIPLAKTAFAAPASNVLPAQATRVAFQGTMQSDESYSTVSATRFVTGNGSGESNQLGRFTVSYHVEENLHDLSGIDSIHLEAANGDSLQAKGVGQAIEDRTRGMYNVVGIYTITGGSGRFAGASGTFTLKRLVSVTVGIASSTFEGYILIP